MPASKAPYSMGDPGNSGEAKSTRDEGRYFHACRECGGSFEVARDRLHLPLLWDRNASEYCDRCWVRMAMSAGVEAPVVLEGEIMESDGILFFDTETTGKAVFGTPPENPMQPRIVQLAAVLASPAGEVLGRASVLVKPDGWTVPSDAERIHGISTGTALRYGIPAAHALSLFTALCGAASTLVAHNIEFDDLVMRSEFCRIGKPWPGERLKSYCTMKTATPVCRLPGRRGFKYPSLQEAHSVLLGVGFDGAHDALADVEACRRVYGELVRRTGRLPAPAA